MKELLTNLVKEKEGIFFDEFMKISENDMQEMYPDVLWYCYTDILATRNVMKALETDLETPDMICKHCHRIVNSNDLLYGRYNK